MPEVIEDFEGFELLADPTDSGGRWQYLSDSLAIGNSGLPAYGGGVVQEDDEGRYFGPLNPNNASLPLGSDGDFLPSYGVNRMSFLMELPQEDSVIRVVSPIASLLDNFDTVDTLDDYQYLVTELRRGPSGLAEIRCWLNDRLSLNDSGSGFFDEHLVGVAFTDLDATDAGVFTVEHGPRLLRAWWQPGRGRKGVGAPAFKRTAPNLTAPVPLIIGERWQFTVATGAKVRVIAFETNPPPTTTDSNQVRAITEDVDDGASTGNGPEPTTLLDMSGPVLARYAVSPHGSRQRKEVVVHANEDSGRRVVADSLFHRCDPQQCILILPDNIQQTVQLSTAEASIPGPTNGVVYATADADSSGVDGGIGSGRSVLWAGGELAVDMPFAFDGSGVQSSPMLIDGGSGPLAAVLFTDTRFTDTYNFKVVSRIEVLRRIEQVHAIGMGVRPVWVVPPNAVRPALVMITSVQGRVLGPKRVSIDLRMLQA